MIRNYLASWLAAWDQFWFEPRTPETLSVMRMLVGSMLFYTHAIWTLELEAFLGNNNSALSTEFRQLFTSSTGWSWSHFDWSETNVWLWGTHSFALLVFAAFTLGLWTRIASILAFLFVVSYANRATGALFGLDQINAFLTLYLAISNCGATFSIDSLLDLRKGQGSENYSVANNVATRLIQVHLCIVYLFAGLGKIQGTTWWNGQAVWGTLASYEYQTLDLTELAHAMWLVNLMTYFTVFWEFSYSFLIWPKLTRPLFLAAAVVVHLGIGFSMGMMTFGLIMIYANLAFVPPNFFGFLIQKETH
ncbi:MAG: HTTM domain-containing protein [Planctomycetota bacterium]